MRWLASFLSLCVGVGVAMADTPRPNRRVALIIENSAYPSEGRFGRLNNPERDAALVQRALQRAGFDDVSVAHNANRADFLASLLDFRTHAAGAEIALIYYAGHGLSA